MLLPTTTSIVETKYYSFAGQRVAMRKDGVLTYLHSDHLGSTVLETNPSAAIAELLFNQSVTWGDVLNHDGGSAALMVFYNNGTYQGGL